MEILRRILIEKENRKQLINEFQNFVWNLDAANETLSELAYDLDFYEPDKTLREEDVALFGDYRLEDEIHKALNKLSQAGLSKY